MWHAFKMNLESAAYLTTMPPIYTLPPEVIAEVFKHLVPGPRHRYYDDLISVSHTSAYFRQVALTLCPSLWSAITIQDDPQTFDLAEVCLKRSGKRPLRVKISVGHSQRPPLGSIIDFVRRAAPRLRRLDFKVGIKSPEHRVKINHALNCINFPILETFDLDLWEHGPEEVAPAQVSLPASMPRIQHLGLAQLIPQSDFEPLKNLRSLSIWARSFWQWGSPGSLLRLLAACQRLQTLRLDRFSSLCHEKLEPTEPWLPKHRIVASSLEAAIFREVEGSFMAYLLVNIEAPKLKKVKFELEEERNPTRNPLFTWKNLPLRNTFPSVTTLSVGYLPYLNIWRDHSNFTRCLLELFPRVERLELPYRNHEFLQTWQRTWDSAHLALLSNPNRDFFWTDLRELILGQLGVHKGIDCWTMMNEAVSFLYRRSCLGMPKLAKVVVRVCESVAATQNPLHKTLILDFGNFADFCVLEHPKRGERSLAKLGRCYREIGAVEPALGLHYWVDMRSSEELDYL